MSQEDLDINRSVRSILVKHWIDLGQLSVRSNDGKLYIRGALTKISGVNEELTTPIVEAMFDEISKIRNIRQVYPALDNWNNDAGRWAPVGASKAQQGGGQVFGGKAPVAYDIKDKEGDS